ncbi:ATP-binding protein [Sphingobacterium thalpophilum]|uniref:sensor histidine kinase n=1 Tax=Sphingobacterium thalpophilum TaxID=259 RepID=UPI003C76402C
MQRSHPDAPLYLEALKEIPLATAIYDNANLNIGFANSKMLDIWRIGEEILDNPFTEVFPGFTQDGFATILTNVWDTGITYRASDAPVYIYNGDLKFKRYFNFEYKPLIDQRGRTYSILHTASDVTDKIQSLQASGQQEDERHPDSNLQMITHTLSRDAKNPLALAKIGVSVLKEHLEMSPGRRLELYEVINQSLENINDIIDKTVELSLAPSYKLQKQLVRLDHALAAWCREAKMLHHSPHTQIVFGDLFPIFSDPHAIYQIFTNLVNNAIKYSSCNKKAQLCIRSERTNNGTVYFIKDNGIGIPQHELENIHLERQRGSNSEKYKGKGLGLFIVKELVNRIGAQFTIFSKEQQGTEVRLFFPN